MYSQTTDTILMIEPVAFGFNAETAVNNYFQTNDQVPASDIQQLALSEFNNMVDILQKNGLNVIVVKDTLEPHTPDSIYPNNWISFQKDNRVAMYPMFAKSRRAERRIDVVERVIGQGFNISQMVDYSVYENENRFLEGTGSMIFDRTHRLVYAAISDRTDAELLAWFCNDFAYQAVPFRANQTVGDKRLPIYHTNVMLSVADSYVVVCLDSIDNVDERENLIEKIESTDKDIIEISENQLYSFAGNVLQVQNTANEKLLLFSQSAFDSLNKSQIEKLSSYNKLIPIPVPTIEKYGGGSVRCMIAEVF
jgi:hypothetical protein